jgi:hypothetical protein
VGPELNRYCSVPDPDSITLVDPDSGSGSGSSRQKLPIKTKKVEKFHVLKCWMFSFEGRRLLM